MLILGLSFLAAGLFAGILAGLLGVGGGLIIVPILLFLLPGLGIAEDLHMKMALGTSLASIVFTSLSSVRAHNARGAVYWKVLYTITPGILFGTFSGSLFAAKIPSDALKIIFVIFLYYVSFQMFLNKRPKPNRKIPGFWGMFFAGVVIGGLSSLVGIGGGTLSVPFMTWCNLPLHTAIGTSAAIGFPIALAGSLGYIVGGIKNPALPDLSFGFVYLPALFGITIGSVLTAPLGARLAHRLPVDKLKRIFALLLLFVATRMLIGVLGFF